MSIVGMPGVLLVPLWQNGTCFWRESFIPGEIIIHPTIVDRKSMSAYMIRDAEELRHDGQQPKRPQAAEEQQHANWFPNEIQLDSR